MAAWSEPEPCLERDRHEPRHRRHRRLQRLRPDGRPRFGQCRAHRIYASMRDTAGGGARRRWPRSRARRQPGRPAHGRGGGAARRRAERPGGRAGRRALCLQQWRLPVPARRRLQPHAPRRAPALHQRPDRAARPRHRRAPHPLRPLRRPSAARPERHRLRPLRRLLLHRLRQASRARAGLWRAVLRPLPTARASSRSPIRWRPRTASACRRTIRPSMSRRPRPAGSGPSTSEAPGRPKRHPFPSPHGGRLVCGLPGYQRFDSMAVDACGQHLRRHADHRLHHRDRAGRRRAAPGRCCRTTRSSTNICFGGPDRRTAYITCPAPAGWRRWSGPSRDLSWPIPGRLSHSASTSAPIGRNGAGRPWKRVAGRRPAPHRRW